MPSGAATLGLRSAARVPQANEATAVRIAHLRPRGIAIGAAALEAGLDGITDPCRDGPGEPAARSASDVLRHLRTPAVPSSAGQTVDCDPRGMR